MRQLLSSIDRAKHRKKPELMASILLSIILGTSYKTNKTHVLIIKDDHANSLFKVSRTRLVRDEFV